MSLLLLIVLFVAAYLVGSWAAYTMGRRRAELRAIAWQQGWLKSLKELQAAHEQLQDTLATRDAEIQALRQELSFCRHHPLAVGGDSDA